MALVLDRLVFELGLDPKAFNRGSREATQAVRKTREGIEKEAQGIERAVQQAADRIDLLARNALRLFAIFTAGKSLGQFAADISKTDAALGRLSTSIGQAPAEISAVAKAVERAGGSADGAAASFERWTDHVEQVRINGFSPLLDTLNKIQAAGGKQIDYTKSQNEQFATLADNLDAVRQKMGIAAATKLGKDLGFDPGLVALLVQGSAAYRKAVEESKRFGIATKEDTEAAQKLQTALTEVRQTFESLGRTIMTAVSPFLVQLLKDIQWLVGAFRDFIAVNIAPHLKEFADAMGVSGSSTKAFVVACEALFALWLGSKALAFLRVLGAVRALLMGGRVVAGGAAAGGGGLLGGIIGGLTVGGTIGADRSVPNADKPDLQRHWDDEASGAASGGGSAIGRAWRWARRRMGFGGGGEAAGGGRAAGGGTPSGSSAGSLTELINREATAVGIDPRIMQGIRAGESLRKNHYDVKDDPIESSWGPFQLNRRRGLGVQFERETGLDVRDPKTIPDQVRWVAKFLAKGGSTRHWMGYRGPRDADPKWGNSGYVPGGSTAPAAPVSGGKEVVGGVHPLGGGGRFTSDYGLRRHPIRGDIRMHPGIDLAAPAGTNVQAMASGTISVGRSGDVTVRHADGTSTSYRHVVPSVKEGDQVAAGQVIARLRAHDPRSTGPHLHFEARNAKGGLIDPKSLLAPKPTTAPKSIPEAGAIPGRTAQWWKGSPAVGAYASQVARAQHSIMTSMADNRQTNTSTTSNSTTINGGIQVQTSATDASGIARDMEQALNRRSFAYRNQSGMA